MRILKLEVGAYGALVKRTLPEEGEFGEAVLFHGPSESGKSTLLWFIRDVLFSFRAALGSKNIYDPPGDRLRSGALVVRDGRDRTLRIERISRPGAIRGDVEITGVGGRPVGGEPSLSHLLGGTPRSLFENVFAFSLGELEDLATLQDEEIVDRIYTMGLGLGGVSFSQVFSAMRDARDAIYKPRGTAQCVPIKLRQLAEIKGQLRQLGDLRARYAELHGEIERVEQRLESTRTSLKALRSSRTQVRALLDAWPAWADLSEARGELSALPEIEGFPGDGGARLEGMTESVEDAAQRVEEARQARDRKAADLDGIRVDRAILAIAERIEERGKSWNDTRARISELAELGAQLTAVQRTVAADLDALGEEWDRKAVEAFASPLPDRQQLSELRQERDELFHKHERLLDQLSRKEEDLGRLRRDQNDLGERFREARARCDLKRDIDAAEEARAAWWHRQEVGETAKSDADRVQRELTLEEAELADVRSKLAVYEDRPSLPTWATSLPLVIGLAAGGLSVLLGGPLWGLILLAGLGALGAVAVHLFLLPFRRREHENQSDLERRRSQQERSIDRLCRDKERMLSDLAETQEDLEKLGMKAVGRPVTGRGEMDRLGGRIEEERRLRDRMEEFKRSLERRDQEVSSFEAELEDVRSQVEDQEEAVAKIENRIARWAADHGLSPGVSPAGIEQLVDRIEKARSRVSAARDLEVRVSSVEAAREAFLEQLNALLGELARRPVSGDGIGEAVGGLELELETARMAAARKRSLEEAVSEKEADLAREEAALARVQDNLQALLQAGGAEDEDEFRRRAHADARRRELETKIKQSTTAIEAATRSVGDLEDVVRRLEALDRASLLDEAEALDAELASVEEESEGLRVRLGGLRSDLERLEMEDRREELRQREEDLKAAMREDAEAWAVRAIAVELLRRAKAHHEQTRQPAVHRRASLHFERMTAGRYTDVFAPMGESTIEVQGPAGRKSTILLSRGTREALFLALRIAIIEQVAEQSVPLPVVLDDALVNLDGPRCARAIGELRSLCPAHQIVGFTCHDLIRSQFEDTFGDALQVIELEQIES